ncbi:selenobiotic family peptide radical SAM maturase [bacterium]|nr:selenobiotic family peptide radical SAM maturase [bacterium]
MVNERTRSLQDVFPVCCSLYPEVDPEGIDISTFPDLLSENAHAVHRFPYLGDLARIELASTVVRTSDISFSPPTDEPVINPTLQVLPLQWKHRVNLLHDPATVPEPAEEVILVFRQPAGDETTLAVADNHDLLALKIVVEGLVAEAVAQEAGVSVRDIRQILSRAASRGLILEPVSRLVRPVDFPEGDFEGAAEFRRTAYFTLQWHITQKCDLACKHCYDRSDRKAVSLEQGLMVLDQLDRFTRINHVQAQVSFSGGNPLLHPDFLELYRESARRGFLTAILGNPMPDKIIRELIAIQMPEFYQISLEGLQEHNDMIRGRGSYARALGFLDSLREKGIYAMVMLTLTRANMDQVLPLAEVLRDRTDLFTFNRLSMVGEGASLACAEVSAYRDFLVEYTHAAENNPCLSFKESLFNILQYEENQPLRGGCTGFGCGAAFNFVSLLPDGEVHACRKFPSCIGNIYQQSLTAIYDSAEATAYRRGSSGCEGCVIRPVCGGCLAVSDSSGQDISRDVDPYCFIDESLKKGGQGTRGSQIGSDGSKDATSG